MDLRLKKGLALDLAGDIENAAECKLETAAPVAEAAIVPDDFPGLQPKIDVKEGDQVLCGQPLLHHKDSPGLKVVSPVAGTVKAVVRGHRRKIERVVIAVGPVPAACLDYDVKGIATAEQAIGLLASAGMLARMRQRPYDIVPRPDKTPRDIFVTAMDLAPLSPGLAPYLRDAKDALERGVALLRLATAGKVYVSVGDDWAMGDLKGAEMVRVSGGYPASNAGVQAANIAPVNKGETIWTLDAVTLAKIGELMEKGRVDGRAIVAITGSEVERPCMVRTFEGASLGQLLQDRIKKADGHVRVISGNPLTGTAEGLEGYLRFPYRQVTVIPEGDHADEFMGWASLSPRKLSVSPSFPSHFLGRKFAPDARMHGGRRAMILSGQYDEYLPMDVMAEYLLKAFISNDIEAMEQLGAYEVAPEDFAAAEYADISKMPLQQIVRDGLEYLRHELE